MDDRTRVYRGRAHPRHNLEGQRTDFNSESTPPPPSLIIFLSACSQLSVDPRSSAFVPSEILFISKTLFE